MKYENPREQVIHGIGRTWFQMKRHAKKMINDEQFELTFEQMMLIFSLKKEDGQNVKSLSDYSDRDRTTTSRMISGLEKRNLVVRIADKIDSRQKMVYLTPLGKQIIEETMPYKSKFHDTIFEGISEEEIEIVGRVVLRMADNLEK